MDFKSTTGGFYQLQTVDMYSIEKDQWSEAPSLNLARHNVTSCSAGAFLFTFSACIDDNDIERLDA